jgi:hypothetical protein
MDRRLPSCRGTRREPSICCGPERATEIKVRRLPRFSLGLSTDQRAHRWEEPGYERGLPGRISSRAEWMKTSGLCICQMADNRQTVEAC